MTYCDGPNISEHQFERYIFDQAANFLPVRRDSFLPYYVFTASRRFFFFLDCRRTRTVSVKRLALSTVMEELLYLKRILQYEQDMDYVQFSTQINSNWFSESNALKLYDMYLTLDVDKNGMLSKGELLGYKGSSKIPVQLTHFAVTRIFEEMITYTGSDGSETEMDYKTFLDLVLAIENRESLQSMRYFFRLLDVDHCGMITAPIIAIFFRDIRR